MEEAVYFQKVEFPSILVMLATFPKLLSSLNNLPIYLQCRFNWMKFHFSQKAFLNHSLIWTSYLESIASVFWNVLMTCLVGKFYINDILPDAQVF